jgi:hypothetical protein
MEPPSARFATTRHCAVDRVAETTQPPFGRASLNSSRLPPFAPRTLRGSSAVSPGPPAQA